MANDQHEHGSELGRFLHACRVRTTPEEVGLKPGPGLRRTPGLRREELATLAGISVDYYIRIERGREVTPSPSVIDGLSRALRLDPMEHAHLHDLVTSAIRGRAQAVAEPDPPSEGVLLGAELLLERLRPFAAQVVNRTLDLLAANPAAARLYTGLEQWEAGERNVVRYMFLHPDATELLEDWDEQIRACVGRLRALAGTAPHAPDVARLIDGLLADSPDFAALWERYDVREPPGGRKTFRHPDVGEISLAYQSMQLIGAPELHLVVYYAAPGTAEYDQLVLLDALAVKQPLAVSGAAAGTGISNT